MTVLMTQVKYVDNLQHFAATIAMQYMTVTGQQVVVALDMSVSNDF